jgi:hypothetical protein
MGRAFFSIPTTLVSTALAPERVDECHKKSNQQQKMYEKKSENNPFHTFASRSALGRLPPLRDSVSSQIDSLLAQ